MPLSEAILATEDDSLGIARVHVLATASTPLSSLIRGQVDEKELIAFLQKRMAGAIPRKYNRFLVIKDTDTDKIVSYVHWIIPRSDEEAEVEQKEFDASFIKPTPPHLVNSQPELDRLFMTKIEAMRKGYLGSPARLHYFCGNLATDPAYQRQGAASKLMRWPIDRAIAEGVPVCLDTKLEGPAIAGYRRLGFVETGDPLTIDLRPYGLDETHTHVAMIKEPDLNTK